MSSKKSRRISPSSAYIGAGNKTSVFSRKGRKPFQELHDIYKKEANKLKGEEAEVDLKKLSEAEKEIIRKKIIAQAIENERRTVKMVIISLLAAVITIFIIMFLIKLIFF